MTELRKGLPQLPKLFQHLPIDDRGYPVPWFVCKVNGKWDFRVADSRKRELAVKDRRCWLCGVGIGKELAFVIGPMCAVNRNTSEPPCHRECAEFAVQACPFMVRPAAQYRAANLPDKAKGHFGALPGNPGAACIWITKSFQTYAVPGGWLIRVGDPVEVQWWCEGKRATRPDHGILRQPAAAIEGGRRRARPARRGGTSRAGCADDGAVATGMTEPIEAYPLQWPIGWKRTGHRTPADFGTVHVPEGATWKRKRELTIGEATTRVVDELRRMHVAQRDVVISTNLRLRNDGLPLSKQREPGDPGVAVYWKKDGKNLVIAADCYTKIADNLAAVAATLEAMRAIKRHGGAAILERAFTGFTALPAPITGQKPWREVLGVQANESGHRVVEEAYRRKRGEVHPDREGGTHDAFLAVQAAYEAAARELGFQP